MRLGLIGLGRIGSFHLETLAALPAVADALEASWIAEAATLSRQTERPVDVAEVKPN